MFKSPRLKDIAQFNSWLQDKNLLESGDYGIDERPDHFPCIAVVEYTDPMPTWLFVYLDDFSIMQAHKHESSLPWPFVGSEIEVDWMLD